MTTFAMTREGLAYQLLNSIASAEGKDAASLPRDYVLPLIRDIISAIDISSPSLPVVPASLPTLRIGAT